MLTRGIMKTETLVVIPAFNEAASVGQVINDVKSVGLDVLVVDDGSTDNTAAIAKSSGVSVLRLVDNQGVGSALRCGFRWAVARGYESVLQVDADGQHDPSLAEDLLRMASESACDLVIGSRFLDESGPFDAGKSRRTIMRLMAAAVSIRAGNRLTDVTSGFRVIRKPLLQHLAANLPSYYLGDTFEVAFVAAKQGYKIREVPVSMSARANGMSSASRLEAVAMIVRTITVTSFGLHFSIPKRVE